MKETPTYEAVSQNFEIIFQINLNHTITGDRNPNFWFWKFHLEMGLRQVEQGFSSFLPYLMIFQNAKGAAKN